MSAESSPPGSTASRWQAFLRRLFDLEATPHSIALGFACGLFWGYTPFYGLKTLLTLATSTALRGSPAAALIGVSLHDLFTPFLPFSLRMEYDLGYWILSQPHHLPPKLAMADLHPEQLLHWTTFLQAGLPILIGSLVIGVPISLASYFGVRWLLERHRARQGHRTP